MQQAKIKTEIGRVLSLAESACSAWKTSPDQPDTGRMITRVVEENEEIERKWMLDIDRQTMAGSVWNGIESGNHQMKQFDCALISKSLKMHKTLAGFRDQMQPFFECVRQWHSSSRGLAQAGWESTEHVVDQLLGRCEELSSRVAPASLLWSSRHDGYYVGQGNSIDIVSKDWKIRRTVCNSFERSPLMASSGSFIVCSPAGLSTEVFKISKTEGTVVIKDFGHSITNVRSFGEYIALSRMEEYPTLQIIDSDFRTIAQVDFSRFSRNFFSYVELAHLDGERYLVLTNRDRYRQTLLLMEGDSLVEEISINLKSLNILSIAVYGDLIVFGCEAGIGIMNFRGEVIGLKKLAGIGCTHVSVIKTGEGEALFALDAIGNRIFHFQPQDLKLGTVE